MDRLAYDYLSLLQAYPEATERELLPVTMAELSETLYCTPRNVKLILTKMDQKGWIRFRPGRGRGHTSGLSLLVGKESFLGQQAERLVRSGRAEEAIRLVQEYGAGTRARENLFHWLSGYFGYEAVTEREQHVDTLRLPIFRPINTLDPAEAIYAFDLHMVSQIFDTLVVWDDEKKSIVPGIAHCWESNLDATRWIFYLRKGVRFHHGRELVADDVAYSLNRLRQDRFAQHWLAAHMEEIAVLSRYAVKISLRKPNHLLLIYLSYPPAAIVPQDLYEQERAGGPPLPVGSGPYKAVRNEPGICVLEAFDHYVHGRAFLDRIEVMNVPEMNETMTALGRKGSVLTVQTGEARLSTGAEDREAEAHCFGTSLYTVNLCKTGPLQSYSFRKALDRLIDRQRLVEETGEPSLFPAQRLQWMERGADWTADKTGEELVPDKPVSADAQTAEELLRQSGYCGETIRLYTYPRHATDAYWLQQAYQAYGIHVEVHIVSWKEMLQEETVREADLILFEAVVSEGVIKLLEYYQGRRSFIRQHLSAGLTEEVDRRIEELLAEPRESVRDSGFHDIEQRLRGEYAFIVLAHKNVRAFSPPSLHGVKVNPRGWVDFANLWFRDPADFG